MIITIDGISCQGKSFIGRILANELGIEFLSTGKIVRYVAYIYSIIRTSEKNSQQLLKEAVEIMKHTEIKSIVKCPYLNIEKTEKAMKIAAEYPYVFDEVVKVIKNYALNRDIVLDGRFTFLLFPDAYRNYYFVSSMQRRIALISKAEQMSYDEAIQYITFRDSFEKHYDIPEYVKVVHLDEYASSNEIMEFLKNDVRGDG